MFHAAFLPSLATHSSTNDNCKSGVKRKSTESTGNAAKLLKAKNPPVKNTKQSDRFVSCDDADDQVTSSSELLEEHRLQAMSNRGKYLSLDKFFHRQSAEEVSTSGTKEVMPETNGVVCCDNNNDVLLSSGSSNVMDILALNKLPNLPSVIAEEKPVSKIAGKKIESIVNLLTKAKPKKDISKLKETCDKQRTEIAVVTAVAHIGGNSDNVATDSEDTTAGVNNGAVKFVTATTENNEGL